MKKQAFLKLILLMLLVCMCLPCASAAGKTGTLMYTNRSATVFKSANSGSAKLDVLSVDYPLYVVGTEGDYYLVNDADGNFTGYVRKNRLSAEKTLPYTVTADEKVEYSSAYSCTTCPGKVKSKQTYCAQSMDADAYRNYLAYIAECRIGSGYSVPGDENDRTFNNTGFVHSCFALVGYTVHGDQADIGNIEESGRISMKNLRIGDIVCFRCDELSESAVDHIGIYVGNGYFVHASPAAGCVVITELGSHYWSSAFQWGVRIIK